MFGTCYPPGIPIQVFQSNSFSIVFFGAGDYVNRRFPIVVLAFKEVNGWMTSPSFEGEDDLTTTFEQSHATTLTIHVWYIYLHLP